MALPSEFGSRPVADLLLSLSDACHWPRSRPARLLVGSRASVVQSVMLCSTEAAIDAITEPGAMVLLASPASPAFARTGRRAYDVFLGDSPVESWVRTERVIVDASELLTGGHLGFDQLLVDLLGLTGAGPLQPIDRDDMKFVGYVPSEAFETVREAVFTAGAGSIGDYDRCSWSTEGIGTFRGGSDTTPTIGMPGAFEQTTEVRFETVVPGHLRVEVARAYIEAHPYEEPAYDIFDLRTPARVGAGRRAFGGVDIAAVSAALTRLGIAAEVTVTDNPVTAASGGLVAVSCGPASAMLHELLVTDAFGLVVCSSATDAERTLLAERGMSIVCVDRTDVINVIGAKVAARLSRELGLRVQVAHALEFPETTPAAAAASGAGIESDRSETPHVMEGTSLLTSNRTGSSGPVVEGTWKLHFDGGSRGNPGPAAYGYVLVDPTGVEVARVGEVVGRTTNNVAEYTGLVRGLERALEVGVDQLEVFGDSELIVKQVLGKYKVKSEQLAPLHAQADQLKRRFRKFRISHVYRDSNSIADGLVNEALDAAG